MTAPSNTYVSKVNGASPALLIDGTAAVSLTWPYSHPNGVVLAKFQLRRSDDLGVIRYWRESDSTWQASSATWNTLPLGDLVQNSDASYTLSMPAGAWTNGRVYSISVALEDANGEQSAHDLQVGMDCGVGPSVNTISTPATTEATTRPTVAWSITLGTFSIGVQLWQVKIYDLAVTASPDPDVTTPILDSGVQLSSNFQWSLGVEGTSLPNGSYRVYVRVATTAYGLVWSAWTLKNFTVAGSGVNVPTLTTQDQPTLGRVVLGAQGHENYLPAADAAFETGVGQWTGDTSTTAAQSSTNPKSGTQALQLTRNTTTGIAGASRTTGTSGIAVTVGLSYVAMASFRAATTGRSCTVIVEWYTSGGSLVSTSTSGAVTDTTTGYTTATLTATAPATAAFARLRVAVAAAVATEVHRVDEVGLFPTGTTTWGVGGLVGVNASFVVERSVDGGVTYARHRWYAAYTGSQSTAVADWEVPPSDAIKYRVYTEAQVPGIGFVQSAYAPIATVTPAPTSWWLKPVTAAVGAVALDGIAVRAVPGAKRNVPTGAARFDPVDADGAVLVYDAYAPSPDIDVTFTVLSRAEYDALWTLLNARVTLLLQSALEQWYVRVAEAVNEEQMRAKPVAGESSLVRHAHKISCKFVQTSMPEV
jgi:hypothetical protein